MFATLKCREIFPPLNCLEHVSQLSLCWKAMPGFSWRMCVCAPVRVLVHVHTHTHTRAGLCITKGSVWSCLMCLPAGV